MPRGNAEKFPFTHDIGELINELEAFIPDIPTAICDASVPTDYAMATRYWGWGNPVSANEYQDAIKKSEAAVDWVGSLIT